MPECIFVEPPDHCTSCSVANKLQCLINHQRKLVSVAGAEIPSWIATSDPGPPGSPVNCPGANSSAAGEQLKFPIAA